MRPGEIVTHGNPLQQIKKRSGGFVAIHRIFRSEVGPIWFATHRVIRCRWRMWSRKYVIHGINGRQSKMKRDNLQFIKISCTAVSPNAYVCKYGGKKNACKYEGWQGTYIAYITYSRVFVYLSHTSSTWYMDIHAIHVVCVISQQQCSQNHDRISQK